MTLIPRNVYLAAKRVVDDPERVVWSTPEDIIAWYRSQGTVPINGDRLADLYEALMDPDEERPVAVDPTSDHALKMTDAILNDPRPILEQIAPEEYIESAGETMDAIKGAVETLVDQGNIVPVGEPVPAFAAYVQKSLREQLGDRRDWDGLDAMEEREVRDLQRARETEG